MNVIDTTRGFNYLTKGVFFYLFSSISLLFQIWMLRPFFVLYFLDLNVKSFSLNESNMNPVFLMTFLYMKSISLLPSPFFLSLRICRKNLVGVLPYWSYSMDRMLWGRRDVTESLHYFPLRLFVFLDRDRCLI